MWAVRRSGHAIHLFQGSIHDLATDPTVRAVVVTGGQRVLLGGNTGWIAGEPDAEVDSLRTRMITFYRAWLSIRKLEAPTIAAVNGPAIGAGLCLALRDAGHRDFETAVQWEALARPITLATADLREGIAASKEKRAPRFTGR